MTLLNKVDVVVGYTGGWTNTMLIPIIVLGVVLVILTIVFVVCFSDMEMEDRISLFFCTLGVAMLLIMLTMSEWRRGGDEIVETHYQVTFDDDTPINEIYEKYEVIDQQGRIFTIKEKTGDTN